MTPLPRHTTPTPAPDDQAKLERMHLRLHLRLWLSRGLLGMMWLLGGEILFWNDPQARPLWHWLLLGAGYTLVATLALDWMARYKVRDVWGVFVLVGIFGILNGVLLNPDSVLVNVPNRILSHALGGHWLIGLEMFGAWAFLHRWRGEQAWLRLRWWGVGSVLVGFFWGVWVRWSPVYNEDSFAPADVGTMFALAGMALMPIVIVWLLLQITRNDEAILHPDDYRLSQRAYTMTWVGAGAVFLLHLLVGNYASLAGIAISVIILVIFWAVLWLRDNTRKPSLLSAVLPTQTTPIWALLLGAFLVGMMTQVGYTLALVPLPFELHQYTLLTLVFGGIGTLWLPVTAGAIGIQTFERQLQTGRV
jgi:hypothetical protein